MTPRKVFFTRSKSMFDGVASSRTVIVFLRWRREVDLQKFDGKPPEDAECGAEHQEAEDESADWIDQAPLGLKVVQIELRHQVWTTLQKSGTETSKS